MLRLILLILLLLMSLLCVFRAPAFYLWYLAIMVTEFPLIFIGLTTLVTLLGIKSKPYSFAGTVIGCVAFILFLTPIIRAYLLSAKVNSGFEAAFGAGTARLDDRTDRVPFSFLGMITRINKAPDNYVVKNYKTVDGTAITLDYYKAQAAGLRPCLLVVHGGSWAGGDSRQLPELNGYLAKAGYNVVSINYRLAPKFTSPAPVEDVFDAIAFLKLHAQELMIDTSKIVLLGRSAGAQIASVAGYLPGHAEIKGVINIYGPADMIWGYKHPNNPLVMNSCKVMEDFLGGTYQQVPQKYAESSPVELVTAAIPPTLIIHGEIDPLVAYEHSPRLIDQMQKVGAKYYFLSIPWGTHGCDYTLNGPSGQLTTYTIERFMKVATK